eukprot:GHVO01044524.1.p1 GENE.GHVO01044524.1~~GHVO01044524.1.p1  ORF type:complete len:399 (+),score=56.38 GHVO01044524.1:30-1226(+)
MQRTRRLMCRTTAHVEEIIYVWEVEGFSALRKLSKLKALPAKDRIFSPTFGSSEYGTWYGALLPYGDRESGRHVSLYLFGDQPEKRVAEFSMVVLDRHGEPILDTLLTEEATLFTAEHCSWGWHEFLTAENDSDVEQYLTHDTLRVRITVCVYAAVTNHEYPMPITVLSDSNGRSRLDLPDESPDRLAHSSTASTSSSPRKGTKLQAAPSDGGVNKASTDFGVFALDPTSHDVVLECGSETFSASRFVLAARSEFFRALLFGAFKEAQTPHASVEITDIDASLMPALLQFLATDTCAVLDTEKICENDINKFVQLFIVADKYQIPALHAKCVEMLARSMTPETVLDILEVADERQCTALVETGEYFLRNSRAVDRIAKELRRKRRSSISSNISDFSNS